jgi:beta-galactosidase
MAVSILAAGAPGAGQEPATNPGRLDTILYGAAYYPEYMPYERLETDVDLMRKAECFITI